MLGVFNDKYSVFFHFKTRSGTKATMENGTVLLAGRYELFLRCLFGVNLHLTLNCIALEFKMWGAIGACTFR